MSRRRQLSEEEEALWDGFVRLITPLRRSQKTPAREKTPRSARQRRRWRRSNDG
jgi:hypothetical protein